MECSRYYACNLYIAYTPLDLHVTNPRHNSSRETRLVSREVRRNHKETTVTFTTDLVTRLEEPLGAAATRKPLAQTSSASST